MPLFEPFSPASRSVLDRGVRVRPGAPDDASGIEAIARTRGDVPADFARRVEGWVRDRERVVIVATHEDVVGWAMLARWSGHDDVPDGWYVSALTVHPDWRRRRIADRLLTA